MIRDLKRIVAAGAVISLFMANPAFADVLYAPGVGPNSSPVGPAAASTEVVGDTQTGAAAAPAASTDISEAPSASTVSTQTAAASTSTVQAPAASAGTIQAPAAASTGTNVIGPGQTGETTIAAPAGAAQTVAPVTAQSGTSADGEGVQADPIFGTVPLINAVMIDTAGNAEAPFSTNTAAFTSTSDGFGGLWLCYDRAIGDVYYRVYTNEHGWGPWAMNEMRTPHYGDGAKVTAVEIRTKGHTSNLYSIFYRATLNDGTTLGWARDGMAAGTFGTGKYIQSFEIKLFKRGTGSAGGCQEGANYEGVVNNNGTAYYSTFDGRAFTGWAYDIDDNKYYFQNNNIVTGWQYIDGYKYYFDASGKVVTDLEPIIGVTGDYIIKINKAMKTLTVYGKDGDNGYIMPVKVILTTIGNATPIGTFKTYEAFRWKYMHDAEGGAYYCQYLLRFKNGFILHSIIYQGQADSHHLIADTYNELGKNRSDGCVRMLSGDAAWVYNNCGLGTQVTIYNDEWVVGPLDRPAIEQAIPRTQNYDPTDPVIIANQQAEASASAAAAAAEQEAVTGIAAAPQATAN